MSFQVSPRAARVGVIAILVSLGASIAPVLAGEGGGDSARVIPVPLPARGGASGSVVDPYTGNTKVVVRSSDGATQITEYGRDGSILRQGRRAAAPKAAPRPPGPRPTFIGEKQIGNFSVQTWRNPDGSAYRVTVDANGEPVGRTNFEGEKAKQVVADAQRGRR